MSPSAPGPRTLHVALALAASLILAPLAAAAPGGGKGKPSKAGKAGKSSGKLAHEQVAGDDDRGGKRGDTTSTGRSIDWREERTIRDWFNRDENLAGLPPGLAKRESLPPGLQKQLARNGALPPGLEAKLHPLPADLDLRLPRLPDGVRRVVVGRDVLLVDQESHRIRDVLRDVLPKLIR